MIEKSYCKPFKEYRQNVNGLKRLFYKKIYEMESTKKSGLRTDGKLDTLKLF